MQNFLGMHEGLHSPRAHPADNNSLLEDASYLFFPDLLREAGEKMLLKASNEGEHIPVFLLRSSWAFLNERIS